MQFDFVPARNGIRVLLLPNPGIIESADGKCLQPGRRGRRYMQMTVVNLCSKPNFARLDSGEKDAAAAVLSKPTRNDTPAGRRVSQGEEQVAARIFVRSRQTGGAEGSEFGGSFFEVHLESGRNDMVQVGISG